MPETSEAIVVRQTVDLPADETKREKKSSTKSAATTTKRSVDKYLWGIYLCMLLFSAVELYSASSSLVQIKNVYAPLIDHAKFLLAGLAIALVLDRVHYKWFKKYATPFFIITFIALVIASFWGVDANDAKRAIMIGHISIQPAEIIKLAMVLFLARVLAMNQRPGGVKNKGIIICVITVVVTCLLTYKNGLTNTMILIAISAALFLLSGMEWKKIGIILGVFCLCAGFIYFKFYADDKPASNEFAQVAHTEAVAEDNGTRSSTHKERLSAFTTGVNPTDTINDKNMQSMYSRFAQAHGGLFGNFITDKSRESARLPLAYSDYIFSIIVEDIGFAGSTVLILGYLLIIARAGIIARQCRYAFPAFLAIGCATLIVVQALVHMFIVVAGPVSGQPLPLISRGGTSILVMSAAFGIMMSVSRFTVRKGTEAEKRTESRELPDELLVENPSMIAK